MSTHEKPPLPIWEMNIYCAYYESSVELVAVVGFQGVQFAIFWRKSNTEKKSGTIKY